MPQQTSLDRGTRFRLAAIRGVIGGLSTVAPGAASIVAGALFRTPPRHRHDEAEQAALARGERLDLRLDGRRLAAWRWNSGPPVLLVHGWGSRGARLSSFIEPLARAGFSTIAFDAPGHGDSAGRLSSLPQFIAALETVVERLGPPAAVVAHSMGSAAAAIAMKRGLPARAAVFLAPAADPTAWTARFASVVGASDAVIGRMTRSFERKFGYRWTDFNVPRVAAALMTAPLLVFHDEDDPEVPKTDGEAIVRQWPGAELVSTRGLGHKRIVHDPEVVRRGVEFLRERVPAAAIPEAAAAPAGAAGLSGHVGAALLSSDPAQSSR
jgi:pimeloyl-ACP methyl ester carboxylesterase